MGLAAAGVGVAVLASVCAAAGEQPLDRKSCDVKRGRCILLASAAGTCAAIDELSAISAHLGMVALIRSVI